MIEIVGRDLYMANFPNHIKLCPLYGIYLYSDQFCFRILIKLHSIFSLAL